jgi:Xaa-Pro aminopeptidase
MSKVAQSERLEFCFCTSVFVINRGFPILFFQVDLADCLVAVSILNTLKRARKIYYIARAKLALGITPARQMFDLNLAQSYMLQHQIDAWIVYDFRGINPVMWQLIGKRSRTRVPVRRNFVVIPSTGEPKMLVHLIDRNIFSNVGWKVEYFVRWEEMIQKLEEMIKGCKRVAMEYSPLGSIPAISWVDGGTLDLVRSLGVEVTSSADLFQVAVSTWTEEALKSHLYASREIAEIKDSAFDYIRSHIKDGDTVTEFAVQEFITKELQRKNLETEGRPIVAVNANSANPYYVPSAQTHCIITKGDWVLIDLWARQPGESNVFSDITWVGYVGGKVPSEHSKIFQIVQEARDLVIKKLEDASDNAELLHGWELDMVARRHIEEKGYGEYFTHRTGHSLGPGAVVHALGVNLDNLENHDTRNIITGIGFSIEPGIYLPKFGVRLEINVYMSKSGPKVTSPIQNDVVKLI